MLVAGCTVSANDMSGDGGGHDITELSRRRESLAMSRMKCLLVPLSLTGLYTPPGFLITLSAS